MVEYILKMKYLVFCVSCILFYLSPSSPLANPSASRSFTDDPFVDENKFVETGKYIHILYIYYTYIIHILYKYLHAISSDLPFKKRYSRFTTVRKKCDVICVEFTQYVRIIENRIYIRGEFKASLGMNFFSPFQPEREFKVYKSCKCSQIICSRVH